MNVLFSRMNARKVLEGLKGSLVGVGVTAFPRTGLVGFSPNYRIVCLRNTGDLGILRQRVEVFCLEEKLCGPFAGPADSISLLAHPLTQKYLQGLPRPVCLMPYQSYPELEALAKRNHWRLLANPAALRIRGSDRAFFETLLRRLDIQPIPGRIVTFRDFIESSYSAWQEELGPHLAIQLPEITRGGGLSTFFVRSRERFEEVRELIRPGSWNEAILKRVSIKKYMGGEPASLSLCITGKGLLVSGPQSQIIDPEIGKRMPFEGVFHGHSWGALRWPRPIEDEARKVGEKVGRFLEGMGYLGIAGVDLIVDREKGRVHPVELNPRLTGAFPVMSRLQAACGDLPMEVAHVLSFLGQGRQIHWDTPGQCRDKALKGGHLILFRGLGEGLKKSLPRAGLYRLVPDSGPHFLGEEWDVSEIEGDDKFIFLDGPPVYLPEGGEVDPLYRMGRLVFPFPIQDPGGGLVPKALKAVGSLAGRISGPPDP